jgi:hypothetical protein
LSSFIKNIYKVGSARSYIKEIARIFATYRAIQEQPENQRFKTYLRNKFYRLLFNEITVAGKLKLTRMDDKFPFEPDGEFVTMMFTFDLAIADQSGFENHAFHQFTNNQMQYHVGYPWPASTEDAADILPYGAQFNWFNWYGYDKLWVPFSQSNQIVYDTTTGFSVFMRIWPLTLDYHNIGTGSTPPLTDYGRRLWSKMDDLDNGAQAYLRPEGAVVFVVRKNGVEYQIRNLVAPLVAQNWYDIWFTFNYATNTPNMYINNLSNNTSHADIIAWNNKHSDWIIGNWDFGDARGNFAGIVDDFRFFRNKIVTSTEVSRMWANKLTIADITITDFIGVFIIGKSRFGPGTGTGPDKRDYVAADYVDADYWESQPVGAGTDFDLNDFESADFA